MKHRRIARVLGAAAVPVVLGVATSVLVAWNSAIAVQSKPATGAERVRYVWVDAESKHFYSVFRTLGRLGAERAYLVELPEEQCTVVSDNVQIMRPKLAKPPFTEICPRLKQSPFPSPELRLKGPPQASWQVVVAGWPMSCLYWAIANEVQTFPVNFGVGYWDNKKVPTRPLITGLLVDSALYALLWSVVRWISIRSMNRAQEYWRRKFRVSANRCRACGYDRTGLPEGALCPECGTITP